MIHGYKRKQKIDYYCYMTDEFETMVKKGIVKESIREDIVKKSMGIWCMNGYYFQNWEQKDILQAELNDQLAIYDPLQDEFYNLKDKKINIKDKVILPRTMIPLAPFLLDKINEFGGKSLVDLEDFNNTMRWYEHITIGRNIKKLTFGNFNDNIEKYIAEYGFDNRIFMKTVQKGTSDVYRLVTIEDTKILFDSKFHQFSLNSLSDDDEVLITKPVEISRDKYGNREWRTFIINGEMISISRFEEFDIEVETYVKEYAKNKINEIDSNLPNAYSMDIFEFIDENGQLSIGICELNPFISTGLFHNNFIVPKRQAKTKQIMPSNIKFY